MSGHRPVLLDEVVDLLDIRPNGRYVDATLGLGGHAEAVLKRLDASGRLLGLDVDAENLRQAQDRLQPFGELTITRQVNFRGLQGVLSELGWSTVDGIVADLGISSPQLDTAGRGFSFQQDGPLDMRLDPRSEKTALSVLRTISLDQLTAQLEKFGEEHGAKVLAQRLIAESAHGRIRTTAELADFCKRNVRSRGKTHPGTRVFLALRDLVNDELGSLTDLLRTAPKCLGVKGRLAIVSFHSLEDRLVKEAFRDASSHGLDDKKFNCATKKPVVPSALEMRANPRSRSAKLRVLERTE